MVTPDTPTVAPDTEVVLPARAEQFDDLDQQTEAAHLGMWLFLATEILFFGGLFTAYVVYRFSYPLSFAAASHELLMWAGTLDTVILLCSSFTMAMAVHSAHTGSRKLLVLLLLVSAFFGVSFLVLHGYEYFRDFTDHHVPGKWFHYVGPAPENKVQLFFTLYFCMTGLHSLHVLIGVVTLTVLAWLSWRGKFSKTYYTPVEIGGLYWHFVDIVWIFLFPLLYLVAHR